MTDDYWQEHNIEEKITQILTDIPYDSTHHFGRPFLTAYQIAIEFARRHPDDFNALGYPLGGKGIGQKSSLAQRLARELSGRIKSGEITHIEGRFLSNHRINEMTFDNNGEVLTSSLTHTQYLSMFRLRNE